MTTAGYIAYLRRAMQGLSSPGQIVMEAWRYSSTGTCTAEGRRAEAATSMSCVRAHRGPVALRLQCLSSLDQHARASLSRCTASQIGSVASPSSPTATQPITSKLCVAGHTQAWCASTLG